MDGFTTGVWCLVSGCNHSLFFLLRYDPLFIILILSVMVKAYVRIQFWLMVPNQALILAWPHLYIHPVPGDMSWKVGAGGSHWWKW